ncbi:hypothetical protein [Streptomyces sp. NPDC059957]|uniref:hypothetical protein n=1 Tax=unclassified Streptomyces TaxID=2593676 RepID=UPI00364D8124
MALPSVAHAAWEGGWHASRLSDDCGGSIGYYHWDYVGQAGGKPLYNTKWDMVVTDGCLDDGRDVGIYAKYWKWDGSGWVDKTKTFNAELPSVGKGYNLRDVQIYVCKVGLAGSCVPLKRYYV